MQVACDPSHFPGKIHRQNKKKEGIKMSESMGTKEAGDKWGYTQATIRQWCRAGLIPGADHDAKGSPWHIPKDAKCPKPIKQK